MIWISEFKDAQIISKNPTTTITCININININLKLSYFNLNIFPYIFRWLSKVEIFDSYEFYWFLHFPTHICITIIASIIFDCVHIHPQATTAIAMIICNYVSITGIIYAASIFLFIWTGWGSDQHACCDLEVFFWYC